MLAILFMMIDSREKAGLFTLLAIFHAQAVPSLPIDTGQAVHDCHGRIIRARWPCAMRLCAPDITLSSITYIAMPMAADIDFGQGFAPPMNDFANTAPERASFAKKLCDVNARTMQMMEYNAFILRLHL